MTRSNQMNMVISTDRFIYAASAAFLFVVEVGVVLFMKNGTFVRDYVGDALFVVLVYALLRTLTPLTTPWALAISVSYAFIAEVGQYYHLVARLGLSHSPVARMILGTTFDPKDFGLYIAGAAIVLAIEYTRERWASRRGAPAGPPPAPRGGPGPSAPRRR